jgi:hypothetical protein
VPPRNRCADREGADTSRKTENLTGGGRVRRRGYQLGAGERQLFTSSPSMALSRRPGICDLVGGSVASRMKKIDYDGYRFPPEIIQRAIWLYFRFTLSFRDVEDLLAERGVTVSYETVRRWVNHFGPMIAADLRKRRPKPYTTWHLDEVYLKISGRMAYLWRAVDAEGEVLDVLVQFSLLTLPSSTPSTSNATSLPLQRIAFSAQRR